MATTTRETILDSASELMLHKSYPATTVDEICEAAGVSKGSFYHAFKTKEDMGLALLEDYYRRGTQNLMGAPWVLATDPVERLLGLLEHTRENAGNFWGNGCLLGSFATDVSETNPAMQKRISHIFSKLAGGLAPVFEPAVRAGGPSSQDLAEQYLATIEGSIVLAKGHRDPRRIAKAIELFTDYVKRLLGTPS